MSYTIPTSIDDEVEELKVVLDRAMELLNVITQQSSRESQAYTDELDLMEKELNIAHHDSTLRRMELDEAVGEMWRAATGSTNSTDWRYAREEPWVSMQRLFREMS